MGKKKGLKRFLRHMTEATSYSSGEHRHRHQMSASMGVGKAEDQRIVYAIADLRDELESLRRCIRALLEHHGLDYAEVLRRGRID